MKKYLILFLSISFISIRLCAAFSNDDRKTVIAEYSVNDRPLRVLSYTIKNQSNDDPLCIWLDQDKDIVIKQNVCHFFMGKHSGDASLYEIAMDNNANYTSKNALQFFCRYLAPNESFSFYIALPSHVNETDVIGYLNKHLLSANQKLIKQWLPGFTQEKARKIMYKYDFIFILKLSDIIKN